MFIVDYVQLLQLQQLQQQVLQQHKRQLQQQAQLGQAQLASQAPSMYAAQYLPSQALAQIGQQQEAIANQPLQEAMQRYSYGQQLPYQQLSGVSSVKEFLTSACFESLRLSDLRFNSTINFVISSFLEFSSLSKLRIIFPLDSN